MYLVEVNGHRVLLECGLYQGRREESIRRNREFPFDPATLDAVVLSHAHIDHTGDLPNLCWNERSSPRRQGDHPTLCGGANPAIGLCPESIDRVGLFARSANLRGQPVERKRDGGVSLASRVL